MQERGGGTLEGGELVGSSCLEAFRGKLERGIAAGRFQGVAWELPRGRVQ